MRRINLIKWFFRLYRFNGLYVPKILVLTRISKLISFVIDKKYNKGINKTCYKHLLTIMRKLREIDNIHSNILKDDPRIDHGVRKKAKVPIRLDHPEVEKPKGTYFSRMPKVLLDWEKKKS